MFISKNLIPWKIQNQKKLLGEGQTNIPDNFGIDQSINQSNLKNNQGGTKTVESDRIDSTTSTSKVIGNPKNDSHSTVDNVVLKNTVPKINNSTKYDSNDLTIRKEGRKRIYRGWKNITTVQYGSRSFFWSIKFWWS